MPYADKSEITRLDKAVSALVEEIEALKKEVVVLERALFTDEEEWEGPETLWERLCRVVSGR